MLFFYQGSISFPRSVHPRQRANLSGLNRKTSDAAVPPNLRSLCPPPIHFLDLSIRISKASTQCTITRLDDSFLLAVSTGPYCTVWRSSAPYGTPVKQAHIMHIIHESTIAPHIPKRILRSANKPTAFNSINRIYDPDPIALIRIDRRYRACPLKECWTSSRNLVARFYTRQQFLISCG